MKCCVCHATIHARPGRGRPRRYCGAPKPCAGVAKRAARVRLTLVGAASFPDPYAGLAAAVYAQARMDWEHGLPAERREAREWLADADAQGLWRDILRATLQTGMD